MKLIALRDFRNVQALGITKHKDTNLNNQIDKGELFEIGKAAEFKGLNNHEKELVAQLVYAGCAGDANDTKVVDAVKAELEVDKKREAAQKKLTEQNNDSALVAQLLAAFKNNEIQLPKPEKK